MLPFIQEVSICPYPCPQCPQNSYFLYNVLIVWLALLQVILNSPCRLQLTRCGGPALTNHRRLANLLSTEKGEGFLLCHLIEPTTKAAAGPHVPKAEPGLPHQLHPGSLTCHCGDAKQTPHSKVLCYLSQGWHFRIPWNQQSHPKD